MSKGRFRKVCRGLGIIPSSNQINSNQTNSIQIKSIQIKLTQFKSNQFKAYGNGVL